MNVVFIHYHLRPGGVTTVIDRQIMALKDAVNSFVVTGEPPADSFPYPYTVIPSICYDRDRSDNLSPAQTASLILERVREHFNTDADIYHIHNPTLGKNSDFTEVINILIKKGQKLLLQIHDFPEDGRPQNFMNRPYPSQCHYSVINGRDLDFLKRAGAGPEGLHLIPNAIIPIAPENDDTGEKNIILYPVRAIRRKNIGESVLLSLFIEKNDFIGITLEPTGPVDRISYEGWINFTEHEKLPVRFRLGIKYRFEDVISRSKCMITTSIMEAFGFSYLEPWTANRMLYGRILPDICRDFTARGLVLDHLYEQINIPLTFLDAGTLIKKLEYCYNKRLTTYGIEISSKELERRIGTLIDDGYIDFGMLNEELQKQVILNIRSGRNNRKKVLDLNPYLRNITSSNGRKEIIEHNKKVVLREYSLEKIGNILLDVYKKVTDCRVINIINRRTLVELFNSVERSHLLLCDSSYEKS